jgi:hypothetical protein
MNLACAGQSSGQISYEGVVWKPTKIVAQQAIGTGHPDRRCGAGSGGATVLAVVVLLAVGEMMARCAQPILKGRVVETLSKRFDSRVELDKLQVSATGDSKSLARACGSFSRRFSGSGCKGFYEGPVAAAF